MLRAVGFTGLAFVMATSSLLGAVIIRSPKTHDHIDTSQRLDYARTPLDSIQAVDLPSVLADVPEFSFPEPSPAVLASLSADQNAGEGGTSPGDLDGAAEAPVPSEPQVQQIALTQIEFGFDRDRVELEAGVPVELTVHNEGQQVHGIWIPDLAIMEDIRSGKSKVFSFTPEKTGRFTFTCSYNLCGTEEEHARMKGLIVVV